MILGVLGRGGGGFLYKRIREFFKSFGKNFFRGIKILYCGYSMEYFLMLGGRYYNFVVLVNRLFKIILKSILIDFIFSLIFLNGIVSVLIVDFLRIKI